MSEGLHEHTKVPRFDGTNYDSWKFWLESLLDELGLLHCVESDLELAEYPDGASTEQKARVDAANEAARRKDATAKGVIIRYCDDGHLEYATSQPTAFSIWNNLVHSFQRSSTSSRLCLHREVGNLRFDPQKESIESFFAIFDGKIREWKNAGTKLDDIDVTGFLLGCVPKSFKMVVTAIEKLKAQKLTLAFVKNRLSDEAEKQNEEDDVENSVMKQTAFASHMRTGSRGGSRGRGGSKGAPAPTRGRGGYQWKSEGNRAPFNPNSGSGSSGGPVGMPLETVTLIGFWTLGLLNIL